jgi:hypothetical protein
MENGINKNKFDKAISDQINTNLLKIINHINTHSFVKASLDNNVFKLIFIEDIILSQNQKENILELFSKGGILKSKDKDKYFIINAFKE